MSYSNHSIKILSFSFFLEMSLKEMSYMDVYWKKIFLVLIFVFFFSEVILTTAVSVYKSIECVVTGTTNASMKIYRVMPDQSCYVRLSSQGRGVRIELGRQSRQSSFSQLCKSQWSGSYSRFCENSQDPLHMRTELYALAF